MTQDERWKMRYDEVKPERVEPFRELLELMEQHRHKNQYE